MIMERLWAPWRMSYIKNFKREKGCLFCRVFKSKADSKNLIILRSKYCFAMLNIYPYNNGHVMISPNKHIKSIELLNDKEASDLMATIKKIKIMLDRVLKPDGYNIGINIGRPAGAGFDRHLHIHIVPRWSGDSNFMPVLSGTKIISQSLKTLYRELNKVRPR